MPTWACEGGGASEGLLDLTRKDRNMTSDEAGRLKETEHSNSVSHCLHQRVISYQVDERGKRTGKFVCKECGGIIPDPSEGRR